MDIQRIQALLEKYASDELGEKELEELSTGLAHLNEKEREDLIAMYAPVWEKAKAGELPVADKEQDWQQMLNVVVHSDSEAQKTPVVPLYKRPWLRYAAVFALIAAGAYFWLQQRPTAAVTPKATVRNEQQPVQIQPGGNKATLTLSNGNNISLDSATNGSLAMQGTMQVMKLQDGSIVYKGAPAKNGETLYNTISIPKGGQYQLTLSDGTKVWLNALTSLHYPVSFNGNERVVTLEGEAYFEVAHDKSKPFQVMYKNMKVEVLGTHFNVMAYEDEATIQTTVLEGKVRVQEGNSQQKILTPGKQAQLNRHTKEIQLKEVPAEATVAWKNGYFHFDQADMQAVLRQLARWYDLEIVYKGRVSEDLFSGKIERGLPLQSILSLLKQSNMAFEIKGRRLVIL